MTRPFFNKELVEELEWLDSFCDGVIGQIKTRMKEGHAIDIQVRFLITLRSLSDGHT